MGEDDIVGAFDSLSEVYDATRTAPDAGLLDALARNLRALRFERLLEVGIGTGRMAVPLGRRGFEITGVDASTGMLARARSKGLDRLVRASAYSLPFPESAFDATLFFHVLHVLERPEVALREACRVARGGALTLVDYPTGSGPTADTAPRLDARAIAYEALRRAGVPIPARAEGPRARTRRLLDRFPPDRVTILEESEVTERYDRGLDLLERRASRWTLDAPPELVARAVEEARQRVGTGSYRYRRVIALAVWSAGPRSGVGPGG